MPKNSDPWLKIEIDGCAVVLIVAFICITLICIFGH